MKKMKLVMAYHKYLVQVCGEFVKNKRVIKQQKR